MAKLYIPACGDRITLAKQWDFDLYLEHRNIKFAKELDLVEEKFSPWRDGYQHDAGGRSTGKLKHLQTSLPKGTVLECDRVYIRTFSKSALEVGNDFDSLTWKVVRNGKASRNQRFWVKLTDCLNIEYSAPAGSAYRDRVKLMKLVHES